ncbi:MAG: DoxX family protein [Ilumatobacteraceae bacterium]|nr:DoxX family protein [Ilumatobacteraceae bacterium]
MNIVLWIIAAVLAFAFIAAGLMKLTTPREQLAAKMAWAADFSDAQLKGIGAVEVLGGIGVVLPALVDIAPVLVPIAAAGLAVVMAVAAVVHVRRGDTLAETVPSIVLGVLAVVVAIGRFGPESF